MNSCYGARYSSGPYSKYDQIASRKEEEKRDQLLQKVQQLEEAGDRIVKLVNEVYAMMGGPCMLQDAVKEWEKAREE